MNLEPVNAYDESIHRPQALIGLYAGRKSFNDTVKRRLDFRAKGRKIIPGKDGYQ